MIMIIIIIIIIIATIYLDADGHEGQHETRTS